MIPLSLHLIYHFPNHFLIINSIFFQSIPSFLARPEITEIHNAKNVYNRRHVANFRLNLRTLVCDNFINLLSESVSITREGCQ
jgi:hypothetical protein